MPQAPRHDTPTGWRTTAGQVYPYEAPTDGKPNKTERTSKNMPTCAWWSNKGALGVWPSRKSVIAAAGTCTVVCLGTVQLTTLFWLATSTLSYMREHGSKPYLLYTVYQQPGFMVLCACVLTWLTIEAVVQLTCSSDGVAATTTTSSKSRPTRPTCTWLLGHIGELAIAYGIKPCARGERPCRNPNPPSGTTSTTAASTRGAASTAASSSAIPTRPTGTTKVEWLPVNAWRIRLVVWQVAYMWAVAGVVLVLAWQWNKVVDLPGVSGPDAQQAWTVVWCSIAPCALVCLFSGKLVAAMVPDPLKCSHTTSGLGVDHFGKDAADTASQNVTDVVVLLGYVAMTTSHDPPDNMHWVIAGLGSVGLVCASLLVLPLVLPDMVDRLPALRTMHAAQVMLVDVPLVAVRLILYQRHALNAPMFVGSALGVGAFVKNVVRIGSGTWKAAVSLEKKLKKALDHRARKADAEYRRSLLDHDDISARPKPSGYSAGTDPYHDRHTAPTAGTSVL